MDKEGTNANTISLFKDGNRVGKPMALPAAFHGKALCPHVMFKNTSLHVNFGPEPMETLPFKCRMIDSVAKDDVEICAKPPLTQGKSEVVFPVFLPDEGAFEWLDKFLKKHPHFVELSDRKI